MSTNLYIANSGARARMQQLEALANNLANIGTAGFRADRPLFETVLESQLQTLDGGLAAGEEARGFVRAHILTDHSSGSVVQTGRELDVAISGPGYFVVDTDGGARYTRSGSFTVSADGMLATLDGHPVLGEGGPISVGNGPARIDPAGTVVGEGETAIGQLRLEEFDDPALLLKEGASLFRAPPEAVGFPVDAPRLLPGSVEQSNVQPMSELASMIIVQRAFDAAMQVMKSDDEATEQLIREITG